MAKLRKNIIRLIAAILSGAGIIDREANINNSNKSSPILPTLMYGNIKVLNFENLDLIENCPAFATEAVASAE